MQALTRRNLLRAKREPSPPRLPWLTTHSMDACTRCGDCIDACEENILIKADGGFPAIDFQRGGCTACGACAEACEAGVFDTRLPVWPQKITIDETCLTRQGVFCQSCRDGCEPRAIQFTLDRRLPVPSIDADACTQCGMCISHCPADALIWSPE